MSATITFSQGYKLFFFTFIKYGSILPILKPIPDCSLDFAQTMTL